MFLHVASIMKISLTAEIYWLAKMASCNFTLRSADHIGDTFKQTFPDSKIAAGFQLSRSSASYMIGEGLAPYFKTVIIEDLKKSNLPFIPCTLMKQPLLRLKSKWT